MQVPVPVLRLGYFLFRGYEKYILHEDLTKSISKLQPAILKAKKENSITYYLKYRQSLSFRHPCLTYITSFYYKCSLTVTRVKNVYQTF